MHVTTPKIIEPTCIGPLSPTGGEGQGEGASGVPHTTILQAHIKQPGAPVSLSSPAEREGRAGEGSN
jgi:hypothetical protein